MLLTRKRLPPPEEALPALYVEGIPLTYVNSVKYLGILITYNLSWSQHISNLHLKVRCLVGMLYRKFYKNAETSTLLQLYISFIRPHLEYCSAVWDPYLLKDVEILEKTQKFGLKMCLKDWSSDYSDLMITAKIPTLSSRHSQARLTHMFKIMHEQTDFPDVPIDCQTFHYHSRCDNSMAIKTVSVSIFTIPELLFPTNFISMELSTSKCVVSQTAIPAFKYCISDLFC